MRLAVFGVALLLLAAGCGSASPRAEGSPRGGVASEPRDGGPSPTPTTASEPRTNPPPPTPASAARTNCAATQTAPIFKPSTPSNRNLELVWIGASNDFVIRDITDRNAPSTIATFGHVERPKFVSGTELTSSDDISQQLLLRYPFSGVPMTTVAEACVGMNEFAWSPDGTEAAYITDHLDADLAELHIVKDGQNHVVDTMPRYPWGTGCESLKCSDFTDSRMLFSPDGKYISLVESWGGPVLRIWTSAGRLLLKVDFPAIIAPEVPTMSAWSGGSLYFRDSKGVERWHDGQQTLVLPNVSWIRPSASMAGGQIVYAAGSATSGYGVYLLDTATGSVRELASARVDPVFLGPHLVWYRGERPCRGSGDSWPCGSGGGKFTPDGKGYILDLTSGMETGSVVTAVFDVWPHAA